MNYIRTKDDLVGEKIYVNDIPTPLNNREQETLKQLQNNIGQKIIKQADTIEELCDEFVAIRKSNHKPYLGHLNGTFLFQEDSGWLGRVDSYEIIYGAIWTDKGLIYVAKMNEKGELELL